jgi:hypothetical protein
MFGYLVWKGPRWVQFAFFWAGAAVLIRTAIVLDAVWIWFAAAALVAMPFLPMVVTRLRRDQGSERS